MKKIFTALLCAALLLSVSIASAEACTSFILKTKDGSPVYGRSLEWGVFDTKSDLVLIPQNKIFTSEIGDNKKGITWKTKYGFVAINALQKPVYLDGMNETGLTVGVLFFPGFATYQTLAPGQELSAISSVDLPAYILGEFKTVKEIKAKLPELFVVNNVALTKKTGVDLPVHYVVTDSTGASIVIEYVDGNLKIFDNTVGVMTNSPTYDWHLLNLRNYTHLTPYADGPGTKKVSGINFTPFGSGSGMTGLPGDYSAPSRFVRAFFYVHTLLPLNTVDEAINQASRILNNFDYPKGFERTGIPIKYSLGYTQWSTIGDIKNKRYYWWTEWNRQMRMVDLTKLNFKGSKIIAYPLDINRVQNIDDRSQDFLK